MAGSFTCDWCGHTIDDFSALNKLLCLGLPVIREWRLHLPSDGRECMERAWRRSTRSALPSGRPRRCRRPTMRVRD